MYIPVLDGTLEGKVYKRILQVCRKAYCLRGTFTYLIIMVTKFLVPLVLRSQHSEHGPFGYYTTLSFIMENFFWETMPSDIRHFVRNCIICGRYKPILHKNLCTPRHLSEAREMLAVDIVGKLLTSSD